MIETEEAQKMIKDNKDNKDFVLLDVRTDAEYMESHIDGAVHHDFYKKDFEDFLKTLDKDKTYLLYCRTQVRSKASAERLKELGFGKLYYMNGGMTKWLRENRPSIFPEYDKTLDVNLATNKTSYKSGEAVTINVNIEDLDHNGIRKGEAVVKVYDSNKKEIYTETVKMNDYGNKEITFTLPQNAPSGKYYAEAKGNHTNYVSGNGFTFFEVGLKEKENLMSYQDRKARGDFDHLAKTDFEYESLEQNYGRNILKYFVKDRNQKTVQLKDLVDPNKKTVLVFGYPGCGACVEMWKAMAPLSHDGYNFIEVVTSVEEDVKTTIDFAERVLKDLNIENLKPHIFYDAVDTIWGSRLDFLTTPNTVLLDEQGRLVNISKEQDAAGLKAYFDKTFKEDNVVNERALNLTSKVEPGVVKQGESVNLEVKATNYKGQAAYNAPIDIIVKNPVGREFKFSRVINYNGIAIVNIPTHVEATLGEYKIITSYTGSDYDKATTTTSFEVRAKDAPNPNPNPNPNPDPNPDPNPNPNPDPTPLNKLSYNDRYNRGEFNHILNNDLGSKLRNAYSTNVNNFQLTSVNGGSYTISDITDGKRPTVIAMGYPTCGACQASWRSLKGMDKSEFNMIEAMTTSSQSEVINILQRLGLSEMQSYFYVNARGLSNIIGSNYVPCLLYLDKDGNVSNVSYFNSTDEVLNIVRTIKGTVSVR